VNIDRDTKRFIIHRLKWLGLYFGIGLVLVFLLPFPYDFFSALLLFILINFLRGAVEVRHPSWFQDLAYNFFANNDICMVWSQLDTLAFDKESGAFVIIEYKKDRNFSVVDQGVAYLNLMLNNRADFILEYNEVFSDQPLKREDVDWSQSRIIFIAPQFTKYQQYALGYRDLAIQLWEVHKYSGGFVAYNEIEPTEMHLKRKSILSITKNNPDAISVAKEIRVYTEEDVLNNVQQKIKNLYSEFRDVVLNLGSQITVRATKNYITLRRKVSFMGIHFTKIWSTYRFPCKSF
jgi:Domain of unknown function (DUF5655)